MTFIEAIAALGKTIDFIRWGSTNLAKGIKGLCWSWTLSKLKRQKKEIQDAETSADFTNIVNKY